jgi:hypothetical protein
MIRNINMFVAVSGEDAASRPTWNWHHGIGLHPSSAKPPGIAGSTATRFDQRFSVLLAPDAVWIQSISN